MDYLVVDLALSRLNKQVVDLLEGIEKPRTEKEKRDVEAYLKHLHRKHLITTEDYLILYSRVILNHFCYNIEEKIGKDVKTGFLFYSSTKKQLHYGAGANYPEPLKKLFKEKTPSLDMECNHHYGENEIFVVNTMDSWFDDRRKSAPIFEQAGVHSFISKRLRTDNLVFGTFECCYPYEYGPTAEDVEIIRAAVQPIKEQLAKIRALIHHVHDDLLEVMSDVNMIRSS